MATETAPPKWVSLVVVAACVIALAELPYGYYQLLRIAVTGFAIWLGFYLYSTSRFFWSAMFALVAVLYNPLFKISMSREAHAVENIVTAALVLLALWLLRRRPQ